MRYRGALTVAMGLLTGASLSLMVRGQEARVLEGAIQKLKVGDSELRRLKEVIGNWPSRDPGGTDHAKQLAALQQLFLDCPGETRHEGLLEIALSGDSWSLIAGAVYAQGTRADGKKRLLAEIEGSDHWKSPPMLPAWMLFAQSTGVEDAFSAASTCLNSDRRRARWVGHELMKLVTYQHREIDAWAATKEADGVGNQAEWIPTRSMWADYLDQKPPAVPDLVRQSVQAAEKLRLARRPDQPWPRTIENLGNLLFHLRLREAQYLRLPPSEDLGSLRSQALLAALPKTLEYSDLLAGTPITRMIVMPHEFAPR